MAYNPYFQQAGIISTESLMYGAGGVLGGYINNKLKEQAFYAKYFEKNFKEWSGVVFSVVLGAVYQLLKRQGLVRAEMMQVRGISIEHIVTGTIAALSSNTGRILAGDTDIFALGSRKILAKNVDNPRSVIVDGEDVTKESTISGEEITLPNTVSEGVHDVIVIGTKKAAYNKIYVLA